MWDSKLFKTGVGILLLFLIIYMGTQISFIFRPVVVAFEALFISFLVSGVLYYFTIPFVDWMHGHKVPRPLAILIVFMLIIGLLALLFFTIGPILQAEFTRLAVSIPEGIREIQQIIRELEESAIFNALLDLEALDVDEIIDNLAGFVSRAISQVAVSVATLVDVMTGLFMTIIIIPFLLYYMLKEKGGDFIPKLVERLSPEEYKDNVHSALSEMNKLLGTYVQGLAVVCLFVGILAYIGFSIIGLDYALILAMFILITNIIPFLGPFIGSIPAVVVGLLDSPLTMFLVIVVIVIVQQLESLVISPQVMGRRMALSPLTIILLVLVAGRLGGLLGIILAIPTFTVLKIIVNHIFEYIKPIKKSSGQTPTNRS